MTLITQRTALTPLSLSTLILALVQHAFAQDAWHIRSSLGAPSERIFYHANTAVWTGTQMLIWGGSTGADQATILGDGAAYNPSTDIWEAITETDAPMARFDFTTVWTGKEMIVWGGYNNGSLDTGAGYDATSKRWTTLGTDGAPSPRSSHTAVWTGSKMIVWGGYSYDGRFSMKNDGGRYDPLTHTWSPINNAGAPTARAFHASVWTGTEMLIWGGYDINTLTPFSDGARYNPETDRWTPINNEGAPSARFDSISAVWTGNEMIIWGGQRTSTSGGRYNPTTDTWASTSTIGAPSARIYNTAIWTGSEMIVWGGNTGGMVAVNDGGRYNPACDSWTSTSSTGASGPRNAHAAVWTGTEMLIWGGSSNTYLGAATGYLKDTYSYTVTGGSTDCAPPMISCPADLTTDCSVDRLLAVSYTAPSATDDSGEPPTVTCVPASGSPSFAVGVTTVICTAVDAAGYASQCTFTVTRPPLGFTGFLSPIDGELGNGTGGSFGTPVRAFKLGSKIPVSFQASCNGSPVTTGVHTLQLAKYSDATSCDPAIDATPPGAATTGNQFRLTDATAGRWGITLDTKPLSVGTWKLAATLSDGSIHEVWISIKQ